MQCNMRTVISACTSVSVSSSRRVSNYLHHSFDKSKMSVLKKESCVEFYLKLWDWEVRSGHRCACVVVGQSNVVSSDTVDAALGTGRATVGTQPGCEQISRPCADPSHGGSSIFVHRHVTAVSFSHMAADDVRIMYLYVFLYFFLYYCFLKKNCMRRLRIKDPRKSVKLYESVLGMTLVRQKIK